MMEAGHVETTAVENKKDEMSVDFNRGMRLNDDEQVQALQNLLCRSTQPEIFLFPEATGNKLQETVVAVDQIDVYIPAPQMVSNLHEN